MATPHVSPAYPTSPDTIDALMAELRPLSPVELLAGAEVAHEPALELPDEVLRRLTLGDSRTILLESPLSPSVGPVFERAFESLAGARLPRAARAPGARGDLPRPTAAAARARRAGRAVLDHRAARSAGASARGPSGSRYELLRDGLVHSVDSDAHNVTGRPPGLREGMLDAAETLPFVASRAGWYMTRVPAALLADEPLPQQ